MMGRCKLTSICGCDRCCIECPENEVCKEQCARMDSMSIVWSVRNMRRWNR